MLLATQFEYQNNFVEKLTFILKSVELHSDLCNLDNEYACIRRDLVLMLNSRSSDVFSLPKGNQCYL